MFEINHFFFFLLAFQVYRYLILHIFNVFDGEFNTNSILIESFIIFNIMVKYCEEVVEKSENR